MFKKLLSNLPFNPSLINQVAFYSKRLKQESSIRRLGFLMMGLTMFVQLFAVMSPSQPSLAASNNDLIPGGVSSVEQLVQNCVNNSHDYRTILAHFGISCSNLQNNSTRVKIRSTDTKNGQKLYSMGHISMGAVNSSTGKATDEYRVNIANISAPVYMRYLSSWDHHAYSDYQGISVGNAFGVQYFILFSCGNIVEWGKPAPPPPPTKPCQESTTIADIKSCIKLSKAAGNITQKIVNANGTKANSGDVITYTLATKNTAKITAKAYEITEDMRDVLEYANITDLHGGTNRRGFISWPAINIAPGQTITKQITVRVKDPLPKTPEPCNPAVVKPCPGTGAYDLTMVNTYGNTITIKVKPPKEKIIEQTTQLTNTGPGTSLLIGFSVTAVVGYFFARSRLMAKELDYIRQDYTSGGI